MTSTKKMQGLPPLAKIMQSFEEHSELVDLFAFNETFQNVQLTKDFKTCKKDKFLTDTDVALIRWFLTDKDGWGVSKAELDDAIIIKAQDKIINPIKDWLKSLKWDGIERLSTWLPYYTGCDDNIYSRDVGRIALCVAVARIFHPGHKYDDIVILEGKQGVGKSRLLSALGGKWFLDTHLKDDDKDIIDAMRGAWIIEVSELSGFSKKDIEWLKGFLSRSTDRCRLSYGRRTQDYPRQSIFFGTTNDNTYLKDDTGNRRFMPILCGDNIRVDEMAKNREQLFAEAVQMYLFHDPKLYLEGEAKRLSEIEQDKRIMSDPWQATIRYQLENVDRVTMQELMNILSLPITQRNTYEAIRIGKVLRKMGWDKHQSHTGERYYTKPKGDLYDKSGNQEIHEQARKEGWEVGVGEEIISRPSELSICEDVEA